MSRKRPRNETPKRALPSMKGFESPERTHAQPRSVMEKAPDQREKYRGMRAHRNPELMQTKLLYMKPQLVFQKYGLKGFLWILKFETYDTGTEGQYTTREVDQIKIIFNRISQLSFENKIEVSKMLLALTINTTVRVRTNVMKLWQEYSSLDDLRF